MVAANIAREIIDHGTPQDGWFLVGFLDEFGTMGNIYPTNAHGPWGRQ